MVAGRGSPLAMESNWRILPRVCDLTELIILKEHHVCWVADEQAIDMVRKSGAWLQVDGQFFETSIISGSLKEEESKIINT